MTTREFANKAADLLRECGYENVKIRKRYHIEKMIDGDGYVVNGWNVVDGARQGRIVNVGESSLEYAEAILDSIRQQEMFLVA